MVSYLVLSLPMLAAGTASSMGVSLISKDKSSLSSSSVSSSSIVSSKSSGASPLICGVNASGMISSGASGIITETALPSDFNLLPLGITGTTAVFFSSASSVSSSSSTGALGSGTSAPASSHACTTGFSSSRVNGAPKSEVSLLVDLKLNLGAVNTGLKRQIK